MRRCDGCRCVRVQRLAAVSPQTFPKAPHPSLLLGSVCLQLFYIFHSPGIECSADSSANFKLFKHPLSTMATIRLPLLIRRSLPTRAPARFTRPLIPCVRTLATTKHPRGFVPPTEDDLLELRESVQEFTSRISTVGVLTCGTF